MAVCGVDVHDGYQAGLDMALLYRQGYRFCAVKLTEGTTYVRAAGDDWIRAARAAGLIPGAYHWLHAGDGATQARWFYQQLQQVGGPAGMLIQLDCEDDGYGPQITAWAREWNRLSGGHPFLIYSGAWWWPQTGGFDGASVTPYLWNSHYLSADLDTLPDDPVAFAARVPSAWWTPGYGGWPTVTIMQFTSKGDAGGLANKVDLNIFRGTLDQLRALTGPTPIPIGDDDMTPEEHAVLFRTATQVDRLTEQAWPYQVVADAKAAAKAAAAAAADVAAVKTALAALVATGTDADTSVLLAKMAELADADRSRDEAHAAEVAALQTQLFDLHARLAAGTQAAAEAFAAEG